MDTFNLQSQQPMISCPVPRFISLAWAQMKIAAGYTLNYRMRVFSRTLPWVIWSLHYTNVLSELHF